MKAWFLSKEDRVKAIVRVKENMTGIKNDKFQWSQCKEALLDSNAWLIVLIQLCANIPNGGLHSFSSIVIEGLGFDTLVTLLLTSGTYVAQILIVIFSNAGSSWLRNTRTYFMAWNLALAIVGCGMIRQVPPEQKWARYAGNCLSVAFTANFPLVMAMVSGNFGGFTKKMTVNSMVRELLFPRDAHLSNILFRSSLRIAQVTSLDRSSSLPTRLRLTSPASSP